LFPDETFFLVLAVTEEELLLFRSVDDNVLFSARSGLPQPSA
jgi:hypothetical protein